MLSFSFSFFLPQESGIEVISFSCVAHPYCLPNFENGLVFSLPFLMENISKMIVGLLTVVKSNTGDDEVLQAKLESQIKKIEKWNQISLSVQEERLAIFNELRWISESKDDKELFKRAMEVDNNFDMLSPMNKKDPKHNRRHSVYF
jgi:hypothetical protein